MTEERRDWPLDGESHQHRGIFAEILEGDRNIRLADERAAAVEHLHRVTAARADPKLCSTDSIKPVRRAVIRR